MIDRLKYAPCGIIVLNYEGYILEINHTLVHLLGYESATELIGQHFEVLLSPISKMVFYSYFYPNLHLEGIIKELLIKCNPVSGEPISFMLSARITEAEQGAVIDCVLQEMTKRMQYEQDLKLAQRQAREAYQSIEKLMIEIEYKQVELVKINEELTKLSITDKLTGLKNRRFFQERLEQLHQQFIDVEQPFYMLVIDIDYFKRVNDTFGHHAGDEVLAQLAELIQTISSDQIEAFRYGGEEFVLLVSSDDDEYVRATAEHIRQNVEQAHFSIGQITVSIGGAKIKINDTPERLFEEADKALYCSKQNGRNRVTFLL